MNIQLVNVGFGNIVSTQRIVAIVSPDSAPIKRNITEARERGQLIDGTYGRRTRASVIFRLIGAESGLTIATIR